MSRAVTRRAVVGAAVATLALSGCVVPAVNAGAFHENAVAAIESGIAETETAALTVEQVLADEITGPLADITLSTCEDAIGPIEDSFGKVQPPTPRQDPLRTAVLTALGDAGSAIADARIAARRADRRGLRAALGDLEEASAALESLHKDIKGMAYLEEGTA